MPTKLLGAWGEAQTAAYLRKRGYEIVGTNYRTRFGEIDLIAQKDGVLIFVEVKTRKYGVNVRPSEQVTPKKLERIRMAGLSYLAEKNCDLPVRFDVAEVFAPAVLTEPPIKIHYIENVYLEC
ncbi:MAG: YraN family protein [Ruminococcaceae bacterium]|nr:YraN family protein [Oscillospiraceae bacterium]